MSLHEFEVDPIVGTSARVGLVSVPPSLSLSRRCSLLGLIAHRSSGPGRSACVACPFESRQRWVKTKRRRSELLAKAVEIDERMRGGLALDKILYLHMARMPLAEAVALDEANLGEGASGRIWEGVRGPLWGSTGTRGGTTAALVSRLRTRYHRRRALTGDAARDMVFLPPLSIRR